MTSASSARAQPQCRLIAYFLLVGLVVGMPASAAPPYKITDLGALPGSTSSFARAINDAGIITGDSDGVIGSQAFLWQNGAMAPLPSPSGASQVTGWAISSTGDVAGGGESQALYWRGGSLTPLGSLSGFQLTAATGANAHGTVIGLSMQFSPVFRERAFVQDGGNVNLLPVPSGTTTSWAWAISDTGFIVGGSGSVGLRWAGPTAVPIVLPAGQFGTGASVRAVNEQGNSAGAFSGDYVGNGQIALRAAQWTGDIPGLLSMLPGSHGGEALGINNAGQIVGYNAAQVFVSMAGRLDASMRATLWEGAVAIDLNALIPSASGWTLLQARDINNSGQIVGVGTNALGQTRGFLLTPVPEPSQYVLMLAGLFTLVAWIRVRRRRESIGASIHRVRSVTGESHGAR